MSDMRKLLALLLILAILGILWLGSRFWEFSEGQYVNSQVVEKSVIYIQDINLDFLKKEFDPAYEH